MRSLIILLVVCAMASASDRYGGVNVVEKANNNGQGQNPGGVGPEQPDISPAWVQFDNPGNAGNAANTGNNDYRGKHFNDPRLRGGK